ncbi:MAG: hypothetical protein ABIH99_05115 [Candidatus Micrarchaeota archaeon]
MVDDAYITTIRKIKNKFGIARNSELVVCSECLETYKKRREKFEKTLIQYGAVGIVLLIVIVLITQSVQGFFVGLFMALIMVVLSLFYYCPAIKE